MKNILIQYLKTPAGELVLGDFEGKLCLCDWRYRKMRAVVDRRIQTRLDAGFTPGETPLLGEALNQLGDYFQGSRKIFDLPLLMAGTEFQIRVWETLLKIPYGRTLSYREFSLSVGDEKAIRAVASASGANALAILVPCHRVIGADGSLTGYAGGLAAKRKLLNLEGVPVDPVQAMLDL